METRGWWGMMLWCCDRRLPLVRVRPCVNQKPVSLQAFTWRMRHWCLHLLSVQADEAMEWVLPWPFLGGQVTFNTALNAMARQRRWQHALDLLRDMPKPDTLRQMAQIPLCVI